jgi:hypothetical protein
MQYNALNFNFTITNFLSKLYNPAKKYHQRKLKDIVIANNHEQGQGESFGGIIYNGEVYYYLGGFKKKYEVSTYLLYEKLIPEMDTWLAESRKIKQEEIDIRRFLGRFFSIISTYKDTKELLGENVMQILDTTSLGYNHDTSLSTKELMEYSIKFKPYIQMIQDRIMDNLIARTLYDSEN